MVPNALGFYAVGYAVRPSIRQWLQYKYRLLLAIACFGLVLAKVIFCPHVLQMHVNQITPSDVAVALIGILAVLLLSAVIGDNRILRRAKAILLWLGRNTLAIMCVQQLYIRFSKSYLYPLSSNVVQQKLVEQAFVWGMIVVTTYAINRYAPWLLGKKTK